MKTYTVTEEMLDRIIDVLEDHIFSGDRNNDDVIALQEELKSLKAKRPSGEKYI